MICGLAVATVMTLVLLPTVYSLMDDISHRVRRTMAVAMVSSDNENGR